MHRIDELHRENPFMEAGMLRRERAKEGTEVGRRHLGTLMQRLNIHSLAPQLGTNKSCPGHTIYPYLLRHAAIRVVSSPRASSLTQCLNGARSSRWTVGERGVTTCSSSGSGAP